MFWLQRCLEFPLLFSIMHSMTTNDMPSLMEFSCAFAPMGGCPASRGCEPEPNIGTSLHTNSVCRRCRFIFTQRKWGFNHKITYGSFCLLLMRPFIWLSATKNCYNATVDLNWHPPPSYTVNGTKIKKDDSFSIWVVLWPATALLRKKFSPQ